MQIELSGQELKLAIIHYMELFHCNKLDTIKEHIDDVSLNVTRGRKGNQNTYALDIPFDMTLDVFNTNLRKKESNNNDTCNHENGTYADSTPGNDKQTEEMEVVGITSTLLVEESNTDYEPDPILDFSNEDFRENYDKSFKDASEQIFPPISQNETIQPTVKVSKESSSWTQDTLFTNTPLEEPTSKEVKEMVEEGEIIADLMKEKL